MDTQTLPLDIEEVVPQLLSMLANVGTTCIIAGHFLLLYDKNANLVVPAISEDLTDERDKLFAEKMARDFPLISFQLGVQLYSKLKDQGKDAKCTLLVNDDSLNHWSFRNSQEHYATVRKYGVKLRGAFFSKDENIPKTYLKILAKYKLMVSEVFERFENWFAKDSNGLQKQTYFLSERKLCEKFKLNINQLRYTDSLFKLSTSDSESELRNVKVKTNAVKSVCLIEDGICNCGGKSFQLFFQLLNMGYTSIVFFVPKNCISDVNSSSQLICLSDEFKKREIHIYNIWNLEGGTKNSKKRVYLNYFNNT